ncbi:MAG TPA: aminotransferase class V-fold PLP-dependent enzyme, partial [Verrucomicrobiae bacterium]|nr:aminotransferase class V-fold PLP-dependent enzyme [Verrucomicrobiae bacterium]
MPPGRAVYLKHAITTPIDPRVRDRIVACLEDDPRLAGSLLSDGRLAPRLLAEARERVALLAGGTAGEIVFTSGGAEASSLALKGTALAPRPGRERRRLLVSATAPTPIRHPARSLARLGFAVEEIPVDRRGLLDLDALADLLGDDVLIVSVEWVNAETGVVQPVAEIGETARARGALFHVDASTAAAHFPVSAADLRADLMTFSAHRMYGPRGAGALLVRDGVRLAPLVEGGVEEGGRRGGAPSLALLAGFGEAAALAMIERSGWIERSWSAGRAILEGLEEVPGVTVNGAGAPRVEALVNVSVPGAEGESLLLDLARAGIAAASGSACYDEAGKPSHVLEAMGVAPRLAQGSVLFAAGRETTLGDAEAVAIAFR